MTTPSLATRRASPASFLSSARSALRTAPLSAQRVTLVAGNESADLDSISSALLYSYVRSAAIHTPLTNPSVNRHTPTAAYPPLHIPLVAIPREDLRLRPELNAVLPEGLRREDLITLDDLGLQEDDVPAGLDPGRATEWDGVRVVLVDHNVLPQGRLKELGLDGRIEGVIDHHVDEGRIPRGARPRVIEVAGSCTSLVVREVRRAWEGIRGADAEEREWDAGLARVGLAAVLVDTNCLRDENKTKDVDREAVAFLEGLVGEGWDREAFFEEVSKAKGDMDSFTLRDVLRKDYKEWSGGGLKLGTAAVVKRVAWVVEKGGGPEGFREGLRSFADEMELDIISVMTAWSDEEGQFRRELVVWAVTKRAKETVDVFARENRETLGLEEWSEIQGVEQDGLHVWSQRRLENSRKQVAPLLRKAMEAKAGL